MTAPMNSLPSHVKVHPAADTFPMMPPAHFGELVEDIRTNGLLEPLVTDEDGALLDGRNRLLACEAAGVEPRFVTYRGDPWRFVISTNLHRRHLTDTQRALVAGRLADRLPGRPSEKVSNDAFSPATPTRAEAAKLMRVSSAALSRARQVQRDGTPELNDRLESGKVALYTAVRVATFPKAQQDAFVERIDRGIPPTRALSTPDFETPEPDPPKKRVPPSDQHVISAAALESIALDMGSVDLALKNITAVDPHISHSERATWVRAMTKGIQALTRVRKLLKEQPQGEQA